MRGGKTPRGSGSLPFFLALYAATYAGFGAASPYLPAFLQSRGLDAGAIGAVVAAGMAVRLLTAPVAGQAADRLQALRGVLVWSLALSGVATVLLYPAHGVWFVAGAYLLQQAALAPVTTTADALALGQRKSFDYGWVRGAGSAAFVAGTLLSPFLTDRFGLPTILPVQAGLLGLAAVIALALPQQQIARGPQAHAGDLKTLFALAPFRRTVAIAALVLGSHALHDSFAVIRWREAGLSSGLVSLLWSESVAAEVFVFFLLGPWLLRCLSPAICMAIAACAGLVRWTVLAWSAAPVAGAMVEPLHGLTFALFHLAAMRTIADTVPQSLAASAQAFYGVVGVGAATAVLTLVSGQLYARFGGEAFLAMAVLCTIALPLTLTLRDHSTAA